MKSVRNHSGFTFFEVIVVVAIIAALAGLIIPAARDLIDRAKAQRIVTLIDRVKDACLRYRHDTGKFAREIGPEDPNPNNHGLTKKPLSGTWKGPYLGPLGIDDNPYGQIPSLVNSLDGGLPGGSFEIGGQVKTGPGNILQLGGIPSKIGLIVNSQIDGDNSGTWHIQGKIKFMYQGGFSMDGDPPPPETPGTLYIFLISEQ